MIHPDRDFPLQGRVFLLTGTSTAIGGATAYELAKRGAEVISPHGGPGKSPIAEEVISNVAMTGGMMETPIADVTDPEQRAGLLSYIQQKYGQLDGIIFSQVGGTEKDLVAADPNYHLVVNGYSKRDLFEEARAVGLLADRFVAVDVPSLWSKFAHTDIEQLPVYVPVAEGKKLGEKLLLEATRRYNGDTLLTGKEVKLGSVCGRDIFDMAGAIATMAQGNFENEEVVFVGSLQIRKDEMPGVLQKPEDDRHIDSLVVFDRTRTFGFYRVREEDTNPFLDPGLAEDGFLALEVTESHTGDQVILPDYRVAAAAIEVAQSRFEAGSDFTVNSRLKSIKGPIEYYRDVFTEDQIIFESTTPSEVIVGNGENGDLEDATVAKFLGLDFEVSDIEEGDEITPDRLIDAACQTLALAFMHRDEHGTLGYPLSLCVERIAGPIEFIRDVRMGELMEMEAVITDSEEGAQGDVNIRVDDKLVARVPGISF